MAPVIAHICLLLYFSVERGQAQRPLNQSPTIVLIGPIDSGKSSLANALLGCDPRNSSCAFHVCDSEVDLCTNQTTSATGKWLGQLQGEDVKVSVSPWLHKANAFLSSDCWHSWIWKRQRWGTHGWVDGGSFRRGRPCTYNSSPPTWINWETFRGNP